MTNWGDLIMAKNTFSLLALFITAGLLASFIFAGSVQAATCNVPIGYATIQAAIDDPICDTVFIEPGTYVENLVIPRDISIQGSGTSLDAATTRLSGGMIDRVVEIPNNTQDSIEVQISNLNIENGDVRGLGGVDSFGGGIYNGETLNLNNVIITNNFADSGGALTADYYAVTVIENSTITHNAANLQADNIYNAAVMGDLILINSQVDGPPASIANIGGIYTNGDTLIQDSTVTGHIAGGVYAINSDLTIDNSLINFNGKYGIAAVGISSTATNVSISNSIIENNYALSMVGDDGEGLAATGNVSLTVSNSTISGNGKEGIETTSNVSYSPTLMVTNSIIQENNDGGIDSTGDVTILDTQIFSNTLTYYGNGGIDHNDGTLVVERSDIRYNQGSQSGCGGGIVTGGSTALIRDTVIASNEGANGAGICLIGSDTTIQRTSLASNQATGAGAGIYVGYGATGSTLTLANSTIANNQANGDGGGIYAYSGSAELYNVTIARNQADADLNSNGLGGGYRVDTIQPVTLELTNTLVALNTQGASSISDCSGSITSGGTNLVRVASGCFGFIASDLTGTTGSPLNAILGQLQNNGGFTPTISLGSSSPAVDAGQDSVCSVNPVNGKDQREYSRVNADGNGDGGLDGNACDIGAYERDGLPPTPTSTATATATATFTPTATATATATFTPTTTATATATFTPTATATATSTSETGSSEITVFLPVIVR